MRGARRVSARFPVSAATSPLLRLIRRHGHRYVDRSGLHQGRAFPGDFHLYDGVGRIRTRLCWYVAKGCTYSVTCVGADVGLPFGFGFSSPTAKWNDGKGDCSKCDQIEGLESQGYASAIVGAGASVGGWLNVPKRTALVREFPEPGRRSRSHWSRRQRMLFQASLTADVPSRFHRPLRFVVFVREATCPMDSGLLIGSSGGSVVFGEPTSAGSVVLESGCIPVGSTCCNGSVFSSIREKLREGEWKCGNRVGRATVGGRKEASVEQQFASY
jgi:hypothetical protein